MSGGGQEGGRQDAAKGALLLESSLSDYSESVTMRKALRIIAPTYFADKDLENESTLMEILETAEKSESTIESEVLNFVKGFPRNTKTTKLVSEKAGLIENTSKAMIDVMTYISNKTIDDKNIVISLDKDKLVITMKIPPPAEPKPEEKPKEKPRQKPKEKPQEGKETTTNIPKPKPKKK
jgi:outer membrane biosynthesis protein TonB